MMKKILILLLLSCTLSACNNHKPPENKNTANHIEADDDDGGATGKLVLNNDIKWKADSSTNSNVNDLQQIVNKFDTGSGKSLAAYTKAQSDLQQGINKMIAECKMKGPDHLALHKWLEPLIAQVAKLKNVTTVSDAKLVLKAIKEQAGLYTKYFQVSTDSVPTEKKL